MLLLTHDINHTQQMDCQFFMCWVSRHHWKERRKTHCCIPTIRRSFRWLYCRVCEVTLVIADTLIVFLTYLLTYLLDAVSGNNARFLGPS